MYISWPMLSACVDDSACSLFFGEGSACRVWVRSRIASLSRTCWTVAILASADHASWIRACWCACR